SCDVDGARVPCPSINTFTAARDAKLDFVAITDHNTITQLADIAAQQPGFPKTLLIPGTEITTFTGHANVIGNTAFLDFQLGSPRLPTLAPLLDQVKQQEAFISVNHPGLPSGEICMGCGWTAKDTDWSRITAIEVINGSTLRTGGAEGPTSGIRFWDNLLKQGHRLTAIGGSDNHDATDTTGAKQSPIGKPATVVYAPELSTKAIIEGVKSGRVFVDVAGTPGATLDIDAAAGSQRATMGGALQLGAGETGALIVTTSNVPVRTRFTFVSENLAVHDSNPVPAPPNSGQKASQVRFTLNPGATFGYIRPEVRDEGGKLLLLGNPIYIRPR
ncbi:MAG: CehA/McbA family metallohydrolase, partial [Hyphomonadaceae bacterium]|nr:CehA/McbA family metallohydrolase [Hyphomonadaceae bacterium]